MKERQKKRPLDISDLLIENARMGLCSRHLTARLPGLPVTMTYRTPRFADTLGVRMRVPLRKHRRAAHSTFPVAQRPHHDSFSATHDR